MRAMRSLFLVAAAILTLGVFAPTVSATSTSHPIHVVKDCSTNTGVAPTYCLIRASDLLALPVGSKVWYLGPVLRNSYFLSSNVRLAAVDGSTSTGYCIFEARSSVGLCTFWQGTGALTGFTAVLDVSIDQDGLWHLDGEYYMANEASGKTSMPDASRSARFARNPHQLDRRG
jgi:hypothetical protein